jgi:drug/metabolite transporter (DMT)-like permease
MKIHFKFTDHQVGVLTAIAFVLLVSSSPAVTRLGATRSLTIGDLILLRCIGGLIIFLPYLILNKNQISKKMWIVGFFLAFLQGWGNYLLVIVGLQYAPAGHSSALGPGFNSIWLAFFAWLFYAVKINSKQIIGLAFIGGGALVLLLSSTLDAYALQMLLGDALFLIASAFGAIYLLYINRNKIKPLHATALVSVYSGLTTLPYFIFANFESGFSTASQNEIILQILYQCIVVGGLLILLLSIAMNKIGGQVLGFFMATVPVIALFFGKAIAHDEIKMLELIAACLIAIGIVTGTVLNRAKA